MRVGYYSFNVPHSQSCIMVLGTSMAEIDDRLDIVLSSDDLLMDKVVTNYRLTHISGMFGGKWKYVI